MPQEHLKTMVYVKFGVGREGGRETNCIMVNVKIENQPIDSWKWDLKDCTLPNARGFYSFCQLGALMEGTCIHSSGPQDTPS